MTPLYGHSALVAEFVANLIPGCERGFGACTAIGVIDGDGKLAGGWVYHNWRPEAGVIEISSASINRRWLTRSVVRALLSYPFDQLECQLILAHTDDESTHIRRMCMALGANEYVIPRLAGRSKSRALITLTDDAWRASKFERKPK